MNWRMLCTILVIGVLASAASGEVPRLISYQGFLMESPTGPPLQGQYDIVFAIYAASSGGTALWTESHTAVPVNRGVFSVNLGSLQPLSNGLFADGERWLNVYVPNIAIGLPRTRITSGVWAMRASLADTALAFSGELPPHEHSINDLSDVEAGSPQSGNVLMWNGLSWVAQSPSAGYDDPRIVGKVRVPSADLAAGGWTSIIEKEFTAPTDGFIVCSASCSSTINVPCNVFCMGGRNSDFRIVLNGLDPVGSAGVFDSHSANHDCPRTVVSTKLIKHQMAFPVAAGSNTISLVANCTTADLTCATQVTSKAALWIQFYPVSTADITIEN